MRWKIKVWYQVKITNRFVARLKNPTKEEDQHKKKLKEKPNTPKKENTGATKLPLPIATELYWKRKVRTILRNLVLQSCI
jgi:hypothetical protein